MEYNMSTEEYIALVYRNLKGDLSPKEFKQLNDLAARDTALAMLRLEIEDAWDATGEVPQIISKNDTERLISRLKNDEEKTAPKKVIDKVFNIRKIAASIAAILVFVISAVWLMKDQNTMVYDTAGLYTLSDQSKINLRSGSRVEVAPFDDSSRNVKLIGEAFFEVSKDSARPFVVTTKNTRTEVLGTSFLIKESEDNTYIDLKTGKVKFESIQNESTVVLTAGMKASCTDNKVNITNLYPNLSGWKDGVYRYKDSQFSDILEELKIIFDTEVEAVDTTLYDCTLSAILTGDNINDILTQIANQLDMKVVNDGGKWTLTGGKCK